MPSSDHPTPTVSRVFDDGTLVELLYDATAAATLLAVRHADGQTERLDRYTTPAGEVLVPYSPHNNLLTSGCVLLPSDVGEVGDKRDLVAAIQAFLHRYVDLPPLFEEIAAHYVLLTWVYDAFNELPYLRFRGAYGSGKTRALLAVGSLCYKPFFASGASTVSPIFHILDAFQGTLMLDEADFRFTDATAELTKVLNNGTVKGLPVLRTMTNRHKELNPTAFRVFGPKIIAMREYFSDQALESRFLTHITGGRALRADIPIHLPNELKVEALAIRNRLLAWRFDSHHIVAPDPSRLIDGVSPRTNQTALALLSLVDDVDLRRRIAEVLADDDQALRQQAPKAELTVLRLLSEAFAEPVASVSVSALTADFNKTLEKFDLPITSKRLGWIVRARWGLVTRKSNGVYVVPQTERARVMALARTRGLAKEAA